MTLTQRQFDMLVLIKQTDSNQLTQRTLAKKLEISLGLVNKVLTELVEMGAIVRVLRGTYHVSDTGDELLAPYRVKRAIFFAAGFGERLLPLTSDTPKALLKINGERIIDRMLDALIAKGIEDIIIVRGYCASQFDGLLSKYPTLKFIDNDLYATSKNISSAYLVKDLFENAYVIEADMILMNQDLIQSYEFTTHYKSVHVSRSDAWCFETVGTKIKGYALGGTNVDEMLGVSYWNETDAHRLGHDLEVAYFAPGGKERFWDDVPLTICKDRYTIVVKRYQAEDLVELRSIDQYYALNE